MKLRYFTGKISHIIIGDDLWQLFSTLHVHIEHCPAAAVVPRVHTIVLAQNGGKKT
jgi:hypothetical protein